MKHEAAGVT